MHVLQAASGRLVRFVATVSDRPGGIAQLTDVLYQCKVSIKDILHERAWLHSDVFSTQVPALGCDGTWWISPKGTRDTSLVT